MASDAQNKPPEEGPEPVDLNYLSIAPAESRGTSPPAAIVVLTVLGGFVLGVVIGYFASVFLGLWLWPGGNLAPLPFLFTLCPVIAIGTPLVLLMLVWRSYNRPRRGGGGDTYH